MANFSRNGSQPHVKYVKVFGKLNTKARDAKIDNGLRVWYLARAIDKEGIGVVDRQLLKDVADKYIGGSPQNQNKLFKLAEEQKFMQYHKGSKSYSLNTIRGDHVWYLS